MHAAVKMLDINMLRPDKGGDPVRIDSRIALRSRSGFMDFSPLRAFRGCSAADALDASRRLERRATSIDAKKR